MLVNRLDDAREQERRRRAGGHSARRGDGGALEDALRRDLVVGEEAGPGVGAHATRPARLEELADDRPQHALPREGVGLVEDEVETGELGGAERDLLRVGEDRRVSQRAQGTDERLVATARRRDRVDDADPHCRFIGPARPAPAQGASDPRRSCPLRSRSRSASGRRPYTVSGRSPQPVPRGPDLRYSRKARHLLSRLRGKRAGTE